jgi:hypothetical protein
VLVQQKNGITFLLVPLPFFFYFMLLETDTTNLCVEFAMLWDENDTHYPPSLPPSPMYWLVVFVLSCLAVSCVVVVLFLHSTDASTICSINRLGIYLLLSIMINLSVLTYQLFSVVVRGNDRPNKRLYNLGSTLVPVLIMAAGYALEEGTTVWPAFFIFAMESVSFHPQRLLLLLIFEGELRQGENSKLNMARNAFSCSMRCVGMHALLRIQDRIRQDKNKGRNMTR